jgi:integrase
MANKQRGTGRLLLAFNGDMPAGGAFAEERMIAWMMWLRRVPRDWATRHGKNRHTSLGREVDVHALIAEADAKDAAVRAEIEARDDLGVREKKRVLATRLVKRMSDETVEKHHGRAKAIHDAARKLGWTGPEWKSVIKAWSRESAREDNRADDPLALRVTLDKKRTAWTDERLSMLLTSTIYTGCFSKHRRWRPGRFIVRDAFYWVPLLVLTCGLRPEEALQLLKSHVQFRDGVLCLHVERIPDGRLKNRDSERWVPLPDVMLRLGFLEWWRGQSERPGEALFPEVAVSACSGRISDVFGKRRDTILGRLGLRDIDEDFYGLRHTFATRLQLAGAPDGVRQSICGHEHDEIINANYTAANLKLFKSFMDKIDYRLRIVDHPELGFPVVDGCGLTDGHAIDIGISVTACGAIRRIVVADPGVKDTPMIALTLRARDGAVIADKREKAERAAGALFRMIRGRRIAVRDLDADVNDTVAAEKAVAAFVAHGAAVAHRRANADKRRRAA